MVEALPGLDLADARRILGVVVGRNEPLRQPGSWDLVGAVSRRLTTRWLAPRMEIDTL
jgi:hypothetical protein